MPIQTDKSKESRYNDIRLKGSTVFVFNCTFWVKFGLKEYFLASIVNIGNLETLFLSERERVTQLIPEKR